MMTLHPTIDTFDTEAAWATFCELDFWRLCVWVYWRDLTMRAMGCLDSELL